MLASLGRLCRRLVPRPFAFLRLAAELILVAVLLGRSAPEPAPAARNAPRYPAHARYVGINPNPYTDVPDSLLRLLDTETGLLALHTVRGERSVTHVSCSPWHDVEGQYRLVGLDQDIATGSYALVRETFPAGKASGRITLGVLPRGLPCWSPDRSDRILFAGSDGQLYFVEFPDGIVSQARTPTAPQPLAWRTEPPAVGAFWLLDPCWPSLPALGGRLLVSLSYREKLSQPVCSNHLWWLQLSPDGDAIVAAERAIALDELGPGRAFVEEVKPGVGVSASGLPMLAFLTRDGGEVDCSLWVMPIATGVPDTRPRVRAAAGRRLAQGCGVALVPAFSADGCWVYASRWAGGRWRMERFAVSLGADAATGAVDLPATPEFRSSGLRPSD